MLSCGIGNADYKTRMGKKDDKGETFLPPSHLSTGFFKMAEGHFHFHSNDWNLISWPSITAEIL